MSPFGSHAKRAVRSGQALRLAREAGGSRIGIAES